MRTYEKPTMEVERFAPNQTIATCIPTEQQTGYIQNLPITVTCYVGGQHQYSASCNYKIIDGICYVYWKDTKSVDSSNIEATPDQKKVIEGTLGLSGGGWHYATCELEAAYTTVYTGNTAASV